MERIYDQKEGYTPYVFYVVFTKDIISCEELTPIACANLEVLQFDQTHHVSQLNTLRNGAIGSLLKHQDDSLYEEVQVCKACTLIRGDIIKADTLDYINTVLTSVDQHTEKAIAILDLLSIQWYDRSQWKNLMEKDFYIHDHIQILVSQECGGTWLHTRGMMKYGRPDISILDIPKPYIHEMKLLMDQIIYYEALGAMVLQPAKFHTSQGLYTIHPVFFNDFDNYDFNNAFIEMKYEDIIKEG